VCIGDGSLASASESYKGTLVLPDLIDELDNVVEVVSQPGEILEVSLSPPLLSALPSSLHFTLDTDAGLLRWTSLWNLLVGITCA
jgi:hypothetical protein